MTKSLVGLHIGSTEIRIASMTVDRSHPRISGSMRLGVNGNDSIKDTAGQVLELIEKRGFKARQVHLGLDSHKALIQKVTFPFVDVKKIKGVLPFELENQLPVNMADYVWDFVLSPRTREEQGSEVLAFLYPRQEVQEWVTHLEAGGCTVLGIQLDLTVLNDLAERFLVRDLDNFLLLDLDWIRANLVWRKSDTLLALRYIPLGLEDILGDLLSGSDSHDLPEMHRVLGELTQEGMQTLAQGPGAQGLMQQIKLTCMRTGAFTPPDGLLLSGMASEVDHLPSLLEEITGLKVTTCTRREKDGLHRPFPGELFQIPVALGLKNKRGAKRFDLLPELRGTRETKAFHWNQLRFLVFSLAFVLLSFTASFSLDIYLKKLKLENVQHKVEQTFSSMVPDVGPGVRSLQYAGIVRSRIQELQSGPSTGVKPKLKVTGILTNMSKALPKDLELQISLLSLDGLNVRFSGEAPDFKTVDEIKNSLAESDMFSKVEIVGANVDQGGQQVSFSLRLILEGPAGD